MSEEETGFTFVDKRRTQAAEESTPSAGDGSADPASSAASTSSAASAGATKDDEDADGTAPTVYDLIGYCVSLLATTAWQKLGLIADPSTGEAVADLVQAKIAIDTVSGLIAQLEAAPTEFVPDASRRELRTLLNDLRLNYISRRGDDALSRN